MTGMTSARFDHYSTLHTIDEVLGIACIDKDCKAPVITGIWH